MTLTTQSKAQAKQAAKNVARARAEAEADAAHEQVIAEASRARSLTSEVSVMLTTFSLSDDMSGE